ncbi:hypothetical protein CU102_06655 [Phyllobacterium brassicacearum]|uniref:Uncharacterized protein n=1 Tax=Phyllobacterium brassicacearum TaxID=314235 RepID=A0A2P7BTY0_9HYPH|nr:hypothetical protein [Phyllobacterium brassicacearum]PSH69928.1 hypothetical protein CU102_06655 [Phyllobacterium brassicacearum]TDQ35103.1 hypothetical protein DEV91_102305 [Phyllobacterium brassicacearum]
MNYWFWLFILVPPVLVFSEKPEVSAWLQAARLIFATALACYTFLAGAIAWQKFWLIMEEPHPCIGGLIETDPLILETCKSFVYIALYSHLTSYIFFSCILAAIYVGINEAIWRVVFRRALAQLDGSHFLSNILLIYIAPVLIFFIICILFLMFRWVSPESSNGAIQPPGPMNYWLWSFIILLPVFVSVSNQSRIPGLRLGDC